MLWSIFCPLASSPSSHPPPPEPCAALTWRVSASLCKLLLITAWKLLGGHYRTKKQSVDLHCQWIWRLGPHRRCKLPPLYLALHCAPMCHGLQCERRCLSETWRASAGTRSCHSSRSGTQALQDILKWKSNQVEWNTQFSATYTYSV